MSEGGDREGADDGWQRIEDGEQKTEDGGRKTEEIEIRKWGAGKRKGEREKKEERICRLLQAACSTSILILEPISRSATASSYLA